MMLSRFDIWLGKTLFVPIAIRICQQLKISQYALHTYIWLVVLMTFIYDGPDKHPGVVGWIWYALLVLIAAVWTLIAALVPNLPASSKAWIRWLWIVSTTLWMSSIVVGVLAHVSVATPAYNAARDWFILLAEYAITIKTIPPLESKEKKAASKPCEATRVNPGANWSY